MFETEIHEQDSQSVNSYLEDTKMKLNFILKEVRKYTEVSQSKMQQYYNKNIRFHNYVVGEKVWLRKKLYKVGENKKLSPRRTGPWTVVERKENGVTFRIKSGNTEKVVHHNRMVPIRYYENKSNDFNRNNNESNIYTPIQTTHAPSKQYINPVRKNETGQFRSNTSDSDASSIIGAGHSESESSELSSNESEAENEENRHNSRYPQRERRPRIIPGAIPWNTIPEL